MNNNIDLTKILKDCPKGWKLYTPIFGEVEFSSIVKDCTYPIILSVQEGGSATFTGLVKFTKEGCFFTESTDVECLLFPSKEQRDWSKFTASWYKKEKFDSKRLKPCDKVLVRDKSCYNWMCELFSYIKNIMVTLFVENKKIEYNGIIPLIYKRIICTLWKGHNYIPVSPEDLSGKRLFECKYCKKQHVW